MSKIKEKKQQKEDEKKIINSKDKKNVGDFFKGVLRVFLTLLLWAIFGSGVITSIKYLGKQEYLPTNTKEYPYAPTKKIIDPTTKQTKLVASFPYNHISQKPEDKGSFSNWFLSTIAKTMATDRAAIKYTLNSIKGGLLISKFTHSAFMSNHSKTISKIVSSIFFLLAPFIAFLLAIISYLIGAFIFPIRGFSNTDSILYKLFILIFFLFGFTHIIGIYGLIGTVFFLFFKAYDIFDKNIQIKKSLDTIKENSGVLSILFMVLVLNQAFQHLPQGAAVGILAGFILMNIGMIMKILL